MNRQGPTSVACGRGLWLGLALALGLLLAVGAGAGCSDDDSGGPACGDGLPEAPEGCDDGNRTDGDGCSATCEVENGYTCFETPSICLPYCGDGLVALVEGCDDGNNSGSDGCNNNCEVEYGWVCSGEPSQCSTVCGDGQVIGDEPCDDGNLDGGDGCSADCEIESGYECPGIPSACHGVCGNSGMTPDEGCDDGNTAAGDGCSDACQVESGWECTGQPSACVTTCGDGVMAGDEPCDDGGESVTCDDNCTPAVCGDSTLNVTAGEDCDTGGESATCDDDCTIPSCGDGDVNPPAGEGCDDGATATGDGCDDQCAPEPGYTCTGEPSVCHTSCGDSTTAGTEQCDDGGESATCDDNCTFVSCGDSTVNETAGEGCDDGATAPGDGCDDLCQVEYGYACTGEPSTCQVDCGDSITYGAEQCDDGGETLSCDSNCTFVSCGDGDLNVTAGEACDDGNNTSGDGCDASCQNEFYFWDDFEDPTTHNQWSFGLGEWEIGAIGPGDDPPTAYSGQYAMATNIGGAYANSDSYSIDRAVTPSINLTTAVTPALRFYMWNDTETCCDGFALFISTNGGASWSHLANPIPAYTDTVGGYQCWQEDWSNPPTAWAQVDFDLTAYAGQTIQLGFSFYSDSSVTYTGPHVDDVLVVESTALP